MRRFLITSLLVLWQAPSAVAKPDFAHDFLSIGCRVESIDSDDVIPSYCGKGRAELSLMVKDLEPRSAIFGEGEIYSGIHLGRFLALHGEVRARAQKFTEKDVRFFDRSTNSFFLAIGNPSRAKWRVLIGHYRVPLGIDFSVIPGVLEFNFGQQHYFWTPKPAVTLGIWDGFGTTLELSATETQLSVLKRKENDLPRGQAIRLSHDISPLSGTKLVLTYYGDEERGQRLGFGILNVNSGGGKVALEWLRQREDEKEFDQLIRLSYLGPFQGLERWTFQYEDQWRSKFFANLGYDYWLGYGAILRAGIGYSRNRIDFSKRTWIMTIGIGGGV